MLWNRFSPSMKRFIRLTAVLRPSYYTDHCVFTQPRPRADVGGSIYCSSSGTDCFFRVFDFFVVQTSTCSTVLPIISVSTVDFLIQPRRDTLTVSVLRAFLAMRYFASALAVRPSAWFAFSGRQIADVCFGSLAAIYRNSSLAAALGCIAAPLIA